MHYQCYQGITLYCQKPNVNLLLSSSCTLFFYLLESPLSLRRSCTRTSKSLSATQQKAAMRGPGLALHTEKLCAAISSQ